MFEPSEVMASVPVTAVCFPLVLSNVFPLMTAEPVTAPAAPSPSHWDGWKLVMAAKEVSAEVRAAMFRISLTCAMYDSYH